MAWSKAETERVAKLERFAHLVGSMVKAGYLRATVNSPEAREALAEIATYAVDVPSDDDGE